MVDYNTGYASSVIDTTGIEIGHDGRVTARLFRLENTKTFKLDSAVIAGGAIKAIADLANTTMRASNSSFQSIDGYVANILDLESSVSDGGGNSFNSLTTLGLFTPTTTLPPGAFAATTISGSYEVQITSAASRVYPGEVFTSTNFPAGTAILRQKDGTKWGPGTYYATNTATATGADTLVQAGGTFQVNSGIYTVPRYVDGAITYYFIETQRALNGVETFLIDVHDNAPFTIFVSSPFLNNPKPVSRRQLGTILNIKVRNSSGGALGTITLGSNILLDGAISPASGKTASFSIQMMTSISGSTVTEYFQQVGAISQAIPNF